MHGHSTQQAQRDQRSEAGPSHRRRPSEAMLSERDCHRSQAASQRKADRRRSREASSAAKRLFAQSQAESRDGPPDVGKLARDCLKRLKYAHFKVEHGWAKHSLPQVEALYLRDHPSSSTTEQTKTLSNGDKLAQHRWRNVTSSSTVRTEIENKGKDPKDSPPLVLPSATGGDVFGTYGYATPPESASEQPASSRAQKSSAGPAKRSTPTALPSSPPASVPADSPDRRTSATPLSVSKATATKPSTPAVSRSASKPSTPAISKVAAAAAKSSTPAGIPVASYQDFWNKMGFNNNASDSSPGKLGTSAAAAAAAAAVSTAMGSSPAKSFTLGGGGGSMKDSATASASRKRVADEIDPSPAKRKKASKPAQKAPTPPTASSTQAASTSSTAVGLSAQSNGDGQSRQSHDSAGDNRAKIGHVHHDADSREASTMSSASSTTLPSIASAFRDTSV